MSHPTRSLLPALGSAAALLLLAACGGSSSPTASAGSSSTPAAAAIAVASTSAGQVLVDGKGRTMYAFAADAKGKSNCTGSCLTYWPPVLAGSGTPAKAGGVTATLGALKRSDGTSQLTADGWPMYTYVGDSKPGAATGQGKNLSGGLWWVVSPSGSWIKTSGTTGSSSSTGKPGY
jgi:predicted lipoprotein with Yx(FWY)xxD motif